MVTLFRQDVGQVAETFGWYVWARDQAALLLEPAEFWRIVAEVLPPKERAEFERAPQLRMAAMRVGPNAELERIYPAVAKWLHQAARRDPAWVAARQRRTIPAGDGEGWMAALDYFAALRPGFHFAKAVYPRHGLVMSCGLNPTDAWSRRPYDGSAGAFLPGGSVLRAHVDEAGVTLDLADGERVHLDPARGILASDPRAA